jgi:DNA-binding transcriptional LysR family regulator
MDISVRQLRAAALVAETLSYARAAEQLGYTEPAVHHQIRTLQEALGCSIFEKQGRGLSVTPKGIELLPHLLSVLSAVDTLQASAQDRDASDRVSISAGLVTGAYVLPALVARFARVEPTVSIEMTLSAAEEVALAVARGRSAIGVSGRLSRVALSPNITLIPWIHESYGLLSSPSLQRPLSNPAIIYTVKTVTEPLMRLINQLEKVRITNPEIRFLASADAVKNICQAGLGLAFLPVRSALPELNSGVLVRVDTRFPDIIDTLWICHGPPDALPSPAAKFLAFLLEVCEGLDQEKSRRSAPPF